MADCIWRGDYPGVAQVNTITPASVGVGNTFTVTINGKGITYTAAAATVADVVAGLLVLLQASTIPEFAEVAWTANGTSNLVATGPEGVPFTQTSSAAGGSATLTTATTTAATGPNHWDQARNWSGGAVPVNGDTVYLTQGKSSILYGLNQSAVTLAALYRDSTYTGLVGLPPTNALGYWEYRERYLRVGATLVTLGGGEGADSGRFLLNLGSVQFAGLVYSTGAPVTQGVPAVCLLGTHASNALTVLQGSVGVAIDPGSVSTVATVRLGYRDSPATDAQVVLGPGCTLTTIDQNGGTLAVASSTTTHTVRGGGTAVYQGGAIALGDLIVQDGQARYQGTGTITEVLVGERGELDFSRDPRGRTVTDATIYGTLRDPSQTVTHTNPVLFPGGVGGSHGATLDWGTNFSLARS